MSSTTNTTTEGTSKTCAYAGILPAAARIVVTTTVFVLGVNIAAKNTSVLEKVFLGSTTAGNLTALFATGGIACLAGDAAGSVVQKCVAQACPFGGRQTGRND